MGSSSWSVARSYEFVARGQRQEAQAQGGLSRVRSSRVQPARCHRVPLRRVRRPWPSKVRSIDVEQLQDPRSTSTACVHGVLPQVRQHRKNLKDKGALRCTCKGQQHSHSNEQCKLYTTKAGEKRWPGCNLKDDKAVTEGDYTLLRTDARKKKAEDKPSVTQRGHGQQIDKS